MGCDKRYGLREVWIAPEASPNTPAIFTNANYLQHCTGSNFPAVYRETLENQEATGTRGQSVAFDGAQNDLSWDVTVILPDSTTMGTPTYLPESLQALFWAAGFGSATGPSSWTPGSGAIKMGMTAGSACGRTIQLIGLDRDKRQLELLTGAIVSQVVLSFSRTDVCTAQFSGVAAQKYEATAPTVAVADLSATSLSAITSSSFGLALPTSPAQLDGVSLTLPGDSSDVISISGSGQTITLDSDLSSSTITASTQSYFNVAKPSAFYPVLSPDAWSVNSSLQAVQSATITITTGQAYGELTTEAQYPTEILSGQVQVAESVTVYLTDSNVNALTTYSAGAELKVFFDPTGSGCYLDTAKAKLTEKPAFDLSSVDTPASGDFAFQGGETATNNSLGFLDTISLK